MSMAPIAPKKKIRNDVEPNNSKQVYFRRAGIRRSAGPS